MDKETMKVQVGDVSTWKSGEIRSLDEDHIAIKTSKGYARTGTGTGYVLVVSVVGMERESLLRHVARDVGLKHKGIFVSGEEPTPVMFVDAEDFTPRENRRSRGRKASPEKLIAQIVALRKEGKVTDEQWEHVLENLTAPSE